MDFTRASKIAAPMGKRPWATLRLPSPFHWRRVRCVCPVCQRPNTLRPEFSLTELMVGIAITGCAALIPLQAGPLGAVFFLMLGIAQGFQWTRSGMGGWAAAFALGSALFLWTSVIATFEVFVVLGFILGILMPSLVICPACDEVLLLE